MPYPALSGPRDARCLAHSRPCATLHAVCRRRRTVSEAPGKKTEEARECIEEPALAAARSNPLPHLLYPGGPYPLPRSGLVQCPLSYSMHRLRYPPGDTLTNAHCPTTARHRLKIRRAGTIGQLRSGIGAIIARRDYGDRRFDPGDPRTFRSDAAINLELGRLSPSAQRRYDEMTDRERRDFEAELAQDAQRRYERMSDAERQRYIDDLQREQRQLGSARRR